MYRITEIVAIIEYDYLHGNLKHFADQFLANLAQANNLSLMLNCKINQLPASNPYKVEKIDPIASFIICFELYSVPFPPSFPPSGNDNLVYLSITSPHVD